MWLIAMNSPSAPNQMIADAIVPRVPASAIGAGASAKASAHDSERNAFRHDGVTAAPAANFAGIKRGKNAGTALQ
jgi:hypothetical protein